jgi:hypothetical protein
MCERLIYGDIGITLIPINDDLTERYTLRSIIRDLDITIIAGRITRITFGVTGFTTDFVTITLIATVVLNDRVIHNLASCCRRVPVPRMNWRIAKIVEQEGWHQTEDADRQENTKTTDQQPLHNGKSVGGVSRGEWTKD